ncbi:prepilin peptidase [Leifsonia sp. TF02-11]|uniref:prepilin peptidase n=1 Tax=Leifsonia sp. TF02-11 TaxID=2815212 RepID=UPI001AA10EBC|nr:prepilin peptidase [Leifsonia sp. TF02-11]
MAATTALTVGLLAIAAVDARTRTIPNLSILALGTAVVAASAFDHLNSTQWVTGAACGALAFVFYLERAVADDAAGRTPVGAGDIKLIGVPIGVFGMASPLLAAVVFLLGFIFHSVIAQLTRGVHNADEENTAHGPALAAAAIVGLTILTHGTGEVAA